MNNVTMIGKVIKEALLSNYRRKIGHLILHVTNRCNMRCRHCFVSFDDAKKELTFDEIKSISKTIPDLMWLDIGGGEPLLRDDLEKIVSLFNFYEIGIPSNGWETELIVRRLERIHRNVSDKLIVSLSLDGMQKTHDGIRAPTSFERTIQTFRALKKIKGMRVKFNTVLCEKNCAEIPDLMHFVKGLRPDFHSILMLRGAPLDPSMRLPSVAKMRSLEKDIYNIQQSYGYGRTGVLARVHKNYQGYKRSVTSKVVQEKRQVIPCLAGRFHLVIWPEGDVAPCELLPPIGNIREERLEDLLTGPKMKKAIASIRAGKCFCTHDCNMMENILFNPKTYWRLLVPSKNE